MPDKSVCRIKEEATRLKISLSQLSPYSKRTCFRKKKRSHWRAITFKHTRLSVYNSPTLTHSHTHTDQTSANTQIDTHTYTLFKPLPGISCHTTCLRELSRDRRCQLRVPQMPTSTQAEEKSSLSPSIICANPSWEIVKSMAYLPNSISHRQVLISYLDPFPSRTDDKSTSTKCDYLLIFFTFLHDLTPDNSSVGRWGGVKTREVETLRFFSSWRKKKVISTEDRWAEKME